MHELQSLERKYIQLLEEKIARLEKTLAAGNEPKDEKADASETAKKSDTEDGTEAENSGADSKSKAEKQEKMGDVIDEGSRIKLLDSKYNEAKGVYEDVPSDPLEAKKTPEPSQPHAFIWRRTYCENQRCEGATATVTYAGLESLIKVTCRPSYWTNYTESSGTFQTIIWNWDALEEAAAKGGDEATEEEKTGRSDLQLFLGQIKADPMLQPSTVF
jgi:hypothetical protein